MIEGKLNQRLNVNFHFEDIEKAKKIKEDYLNQDYSIASEYWPTGQDDDQYGYFKLEMKAQFTAEKVNENEK